MLLNALLSCATLSFLIPTVVDHSYHISCCYLHISFASAVCLPTRALHRVFIFVFSTKHFYFTDPKMRPSVPLRFLISLHRNSSQPTHNLQQFVPAHRQVPDEYIAKLEEFLIDKRRILVLTGAGISTESGNWFSIYKSSSTYVFDCKWEWQMDYVLLFLPGIPDYRSEGVGMFARTHHRPTQHMEFIRSLRTRQRYWSRNFIAWPKFSSIQPNATHFAVARFEAEGRLSGLITQNVDRLHRKAGSKKMIELHGHTHSVVCVGKSHQAGLKDQSCGYSVHRHKFQEELHELNSALGLLELGDTVMRPDGDVEVPQVGIAQLYYIIIKCNSLFLNAGIRRPIPITRLPRLRRQSQTGRCLLRR